MIALFKSVKVQVDIKLTGADAASLAGAWQELERAARSSHLEEVHRGSTVISRSVEEVLKKELKRVGTALQAAEEGQVHTLQDRQSIFFSLKESGFLRFCM